MAGTGIIGRKYDVRRIFSFNYPFFEKTEGAEVMATLDWFVRSICEKYPHIIPFVIRSLIERIF